MDTNISDQYYKENSDKNNDSSLTSENRIYQDVYEERLIEIDFETQSFKSLVGRFINDRNQSYQNDDNLELETKLYLKEKDEVNTNDITSSNEDNDCYEINHNSITNIEYNPLEYSNSLERNLMNNSIEYKANDSESTMTTHTQPLMRESDENKNNEQVIVKEETVKSELKEEINETLPSSPLNNGKKSDKKINKFTLKTKNFINKIGTTKKHVSLNDETTFYESEKTTEQDLKTIKDANVSNGNGSTTNNNYFTKEGKSLVDHEDINKKRIQNSYNDDEDQNKTLTRNNCFNANKKEQSKFGKKFRTGLKFLSLRKRSDQQDQQKTKYSKPNNTVSETFEKFENMNLKTLESYEFAIEIEDSMFKNIESNQTYLQQEPKQHDSSIIQPIENEPKKTNFKDLLTKTSEIQTNNPPQRSKCSIM